MSTNDMLEEIAQIACKAYKKNSRGCIEALKLDRHEAIEVEGIEFTCWREYTIYRMGQYVQDKLPDASIVVTLDGNNSTVEVACTDAEQKKLNAYMHTFLKSLEVKNEVM